MKNHNRSSVRVLLGVLLVLTFLTALPLWAAVEKPTHLLFLVFDQMRPDYVDRFDLKNFKRLRKMGTNYKNGYVGHGASVTVVSHYVMTTGLLPRDLPWTENQLWDQKGQLGATDQVYDTLRISPEQRFKLMSAVAPEQYLVKRFKETTGKKVFAIGEKEYSALAMGGPYADAIVYPSKAKQDKNCKPVGQNVPAYILKQDRYTIDCTSTYGTENSTYTLDGNRFYPGTDKDHLGGDIWVADAALDIMKNESNWGAMLLTFGAIDRFGHMLGETDRNTPHAFEPPMHLKEIAQVADAQLGRLLDYLEKEKILKSTLIISTADHGGQTDEIFLGGGSKEEGFWIQRVSKMAPIKLIMADTGLRIWLKDGNATNAEKTVNGLKEIAQVTQVFVLDRSQNPPRYKLAYDNLASQPKAHQKWAKAHNLELANTFASSTAPDVVAALADEVGFGRLGDHGGFQERVQRIPMMIAGPGYPSRVDTRALRLADLAPLISKSFGLKPAPIEAPAP